jgi:DNA-binding MarR family transcriptional regulator
MSYIITTAVILFLMVALALVMSMLRVASEYDNHSERIYNAQMCLTHSERKVYNYLCEHEQWWPGYKQMSVVLGMKQSSIRSACKKLEERGHLEFKKIRQKNGTLQGSGYFVIKKK